MSTQTTIAKSKALLGIEPRFQRATAVLFPVELQGHWATLNRIENLFFGCGAVVRTQPETVADQGLLPGISRVRWRAWAETAALETDGPASPAHCWLMAHFERPGLLGHLLKSLIWFESRLQPLKEAK